MSTATMSASDLEVTKELEAEINSIKVDSGSTSTDVSYKPEAWTREGRVD